MSMGFSVKISKGEKFYIARVPELGITTQGKTRSEAKKNLREAMQVHLEAMADYAIKHGRVALEEGQLGPRKGASQRSDAAGHSSLYPPVTG
jgi:predicted RNase H-like HicB family nuclease